MKETIENIILQKDQRGMTELRPHVPADFCFQAAQHILDHPGNAAMVTGFYVLMSDKPETDVRTFCTSSRTTAEMYSRFSAATRTRSDTG